MFKRCEFCALKSAKCLRIDKAPIANQDKPLSALEALYIFKKELVHRIVSTTTLGFICLKCAATLDNCYTFAQQMQRAQEKLQQSSSDMVPTKGHGPKQKKLADVDIKLSLRKTERTLLPKTTEYEAPTVQISASKLIRSYKCVECPQLLSSFRQLKQHEATHELVDISVCNYCCSLFANAETLEQHIRERHADSKYVCLPCARQYKNKGHLLKHVVHAHKHNELIYYCCLCPRQTTPVEYDSKLSLQQHFQAVHLHMPSQEDVDDVEIEMNEEFLDEFLLQNTNENSFQFSEWDALDLHLPDVLHLNEHNTGEQPGSDGTLAAYKCPNCCEQFADLKTLLAHLAQLHSLQLLICHQCEDSFKNVADLWKHRKTHRLKERSKSEKQGISLQAHECPYCGKIFAALINLKQHMRNIHAQLKKHVCLLCDKQFATLDHLKKHVLSQHQNERKHVCDVCAKRFTQLCHLKQHLAIHTTGKSFHCDDCGTSYWRKIDLERHLLKKHPQKSN